MESSVKRMLPITQICRKTVQTSLKSVQQDDHKKTVTAEIVQDLPVANDLISAIIDCEEKPKNENTIKRSRRKNVKSVKGMLPKALIADQTSQKTAKDLKLTDMSSRSTKTSLRIEQSSDSNNGKELCKGRVIDNEEQTSERWTIVKKPRQQRARHSDDVATSAIEKSREQTSRIEKLSGFEVKANRAAYKRKTVDALNKSGNTNVKNSFPEQKRNTGEENTRIRRNVIETKLSSKSVIQSSNKEKARVPETVIRESATNATNAGSTNRHRQCKTEELKRNVRSTIVKVKDVRMIEGPPGRVDRRDKVANSKDGGERENLRVENVLPSDTAGQETDTKTVTLFVPKYIAQTGFDPQMNDEIRRLAKEMLDEYEKSYNLDNIIFSLIDEENSCIRTRHQQFVTCMTIVSLDGSSNKRKVVGKMFAELLSKKVVSVNAITQGFDMVFRDYNDYLTKYPSFFSYVASIIAPLLISKTAPFEYSNLKYACFSIRPNSSGLLFAEILQEILNYEETRNLTDFCGTLRTFNKWSSQPKHVPLDVFMPANQIKKFIKKDRVGTLLLAMALFDIKKVVNSDGLLNDITHKWIKRNIDADIIREPSFVRTLTIATVIACTNRPKIHANEDLMDRGRGELLDRYVRHELPESEIRSREIECFDGCAIISTALGEQEKYGGMSFRVFFQLYRDGVVSTESLEAWRNKESSSRSATASALKLFFNGMDSWKSIAIKA